MDTSLDDGREAEERQLDELKQELCAMLQTEKGEMRRRMMLIVAQLSRLEVRMIETDGQVRDRTALSVRVTRVTKRARVDC